MVKRGYRGSGRSASKAPYLYGAIITIVIVAAVPVFAWFYGVQSPWNFQISTTQTGQTGQTGTTPGQVVQTGLVPVTKPVDLTVQDRLAGGAIASGTAYLYNPTTKMLLETLTVGSDGTISSNLAYLSGTNLAIRITKSGYVDTWIPVSVPMMSAVDAESLTVNAIPIYQKNVGTGSVAAVLGSNGSALTDEALYNITSTDLSIAMTLTNTEDNSGWSKSYDLLNGVNQGLWAKIYCNNSDLAITGYQRAVTRGSTTYYFIEIPESSFDKQKIGNEYPTYKGSYGFTLNVDMGSLSDGEVERLTVDIMDYFDPDYFALNGNGGPNQAELCDFILDFQGDA